MGKNTIGIMGKTALHNFQAERYRFILADIKVITQHITRVYGKGSRRTLNILHDILAKCTTNASSL